MTDWTVVHWCDRNGYLVMHLYPTAGREHELSADCWCNPSCEVDADSRCVEIDHRREQ